MQPYAESDKVGSLAAKNICLKNQHIKINVDVAMAARIVAAAQCSQKQCSEIS